MLARRPDQGYNLLISLTFICFPGQAGRQGKALAVGPGQFVGTGGEATQSAVRSPQSYWLMYCFKPPFLTGKPMAKM